MKIVLESPDRISSVQHSVMYLLGNANYSTVVYDSGEVVVMAYTLAKYEQVLPGFIRVHKRHLINPRYVTALTPTHVVMMDEVRLPIARRRHADVVKLLKP
ncbi:LytTR family DNA-binding domain-containing protein [Spirosoma validum]|uniref:LytTR family transcriptional regulator n=1 Tax=Spirosoma validum TaxID=2771355 RepID=A0A927GDK1_9BACT|nr:LytTR family DNA-binding domain-containing protein [Spirosoma validum]MBD2753804.1 LytTR family transcriptional regulator [Spirosoma validum]